MSTTLVQAKPGWKSSTVIVNALFILALLPEILELAIASSGELGIPDVWLPRIGFLVAVFNVINRRRTEQPIRFRAESLEQPVSVPAARKQMQPRKETR